MWTHQHLVVRKEIIMTTARPLTPWARRIGAAVVLAGGIGLTAALPATASADTIQCSPQAHSAAQTQAAPQVAAVLARHPDLAAELAHLKTLPKSDRKSQFHAFATSHRQEVKELRQARKPIHEYRQSCRAH